MFLDLLAPARRLGDGWAQGPHPYLKIDAWFAQAADLVGVLRPEDFARIDGVIQRLQIEAEWGVGESEADELSADVDEILPVVSQHSVPGRLDRYVWRL